VVDADDADCAGGEPVFLNGEYAGYVTSGGTGYCVGESLAVGYLEPEAVEDGAAVEIEIVGRRRPATVATAPRIDPNGGRMRA
jgi:dimethylglycine dehydrogenase